MKKLFFLIILLLCLARLVYAAGVTESALTLLEPTSARTAALGESCAALRNDVNPVAYNPATLDTLRSSQISFLFQRGLGSDNFGHAAVGLPFDKHAFGVDIRSYDSGTID